MKRDAAASAVRFAGELAQFDQEQREIREPAAFPATPETHKGRRSPAHGLLLPRGSEIETASTRLVARGALPEEPETTPTRTGAAFRPRRPRARRALARPRPSAPSTRARTGRRASGTPRAYRRLFGRRAAVQPCRSSGSPAGGRRCRGGP